MTDGNEEARRHHDLIDATRASRDEAAVKTGSEAIRWVLLANGGAIAAVLSFLGALAAKANVDHQGFLAVTTTLFYFAWGVLFCLLAMLLAYLTNYFFGARDSSRQKIWAHPYAEDTKLSMRYNRCGSTTSMTAFICGAIGVALFMVGITQLSCAVQKLFPAEKINLKTVDPPKLNSSIPPSH